MEGWPSRKEEKKLFFYSFCKGIMTSCRGKDAKTKGMPPKPGQSKRQIR
jgi:hypothetical protein